MILLNSERPRDSNLTCVFVHGAGNSLATDPALGTITSEFWSYWGRLHEVIGGENGPCQVLTFMHLDTLHAGWQDAELQESFCAQLEITGGGARTSRGNATTHSPVNSSSARVALFSHSLGNLIVAGALNADRCLLPPGATWYAIAAPWAGTKAADELPRICSGSERVVGGLVKALARNQGFCEGPEEEGTPSRGFASLQTESDHLQAVSARWQWRVNGSLCGTAAFGLWAAEGGGADSYELQALADLVQFGDANDGAVPLATCHPFGTMAVPGEPENAHYTAAVNHYDLTCRHGDGWILPWRSADRQPCQWYRAMATQAATATAATYAPS